MCFQQRPRQELEALRIEIEKLHADHLKHTRHENAQVDRQVFASSDNSTCSNADT